MNDTPDRREDAPETELQKTAPEAEPPKKTNQNAQRDNVRRAIMVVAGGYLIYLGVQLAKMYAEGTGDRTGQVVSLVAAILFIPFGAVVLVMNLRAAFRNFRDSIANMPDYEAEDEEPEAIEAPEDEEEEEEPKAIEAPDDAPDETSDEEA